MHKRAFSFYSLLFNILVVLVCAGAGGAALAAPSSTSCAGGVPCIDPYEPGTGANDAKAGNPTCDGDFMNQIYSRAYMESERKLVTYQSKLRKPDSVLQYTCFDKLSSVTAKKAGEIFSDSEEWHNKIIDLSAGPFGNLAFLTPDDILGALVDMFVNFTQQQLQSLLNKMMPKELQELRRQLLAALPPEVLDELGADPEIYDIMDALHMADPAILSHVLSGVAADQLFDLADSLGINGLGANTRIRIDVYMGEDNLDKSLESVVLSSLKDYTDANFNHDFLGGAAGIRGDMSDEVGGGDYTCTAMRDVEHIARCSDFGADGDPGFQDFQQLSQNDPRQLPQACSGTMVKQETMDAASNKGGKTVKYDNLAKTYVDKLGDNKDGKIECGDPYGPETEVTITEARPGSDMSGGAPVSVSSKIVKVRNCSNAACHYDPDAKQCVENK